MRKAFRSAWKTAGNENDRVSHQELQEDRSWTDSPRQDSSENPCQPDQYAEEESDVITHGSQSSHRANVWAQRSMSSPQAQQQSGPSTPSLVSEDVPPPYERSVSIQALPDVGFSTDRSCPETIVHTTPRQDLEKSASGVPFQKSRVENLPIRSPDCKEVDAKRFLPSAASVMCKPGKTPPLYSSAFSSFADPATFLESGKRNLTPQAIPEAFKSPSVRKILSLDGGGVRGLSEITMLRYLMQELGRQRGFPPDEYLEPWQEFDMIVGTSTGGLLAIMLGRLRMSIRECEGVYLKFLAMIFTRTRMSGNVLGRTYDFLQANGKFQAAPLENLVRKLLKDHGMPEEELFWEKNANEQTCKVVVCAAYNNTKTCRLRSYINVHAYDPLRETCQIWQAARATSAASTFFEPITIGHADSKLFDGAQSGMNNPIEIAHNESRVIFPGEERIIVSLGTGVPAMTNISGNIRKLLKAMIEVATDAERQSELFLEGALSMVEARRLFRFNVTGDLGGIGLEEHKHTSEIILLMEAYIHGYSTKRNFEACAEAMKDAGQRLHYIAGDDLARYLDKCVSAARCCYCRQGITFNTISAHCLICAKSMCIPCNARHHTHHKEYVSQIENIRWQAKRRDFNEDQQCLCCWSSRRCRLACRKCSFAVCEACLNEESGQILHLQEHHKRHPDHCSFLRVRSPNWSLNTASLEPCECLSDTSSVDHCNRCSCEIYLDEASFCCRTCRLESGTKAKFCPSCIDDADVMDHKRSHEFQTIYYKKMKDAPAYEAPEYIDRLECLQCGEKFPAENIDSVQHAHVEFCLVLSPEALEDKRRRMVRECPLRPSIDTTRENESCFVPKVRCHFCDGTIHYDERAGLCLTGGCGNFYCNSCFISQCHGHRHAVQGIILKRASLTDGKKRRGLCIWCRRKCTLGAFHGLVCEFCLKVFVCSHCVSISSGGGSTIHLELRHECLADSTFFQ